MREFDARVHALLRFEPGVRGPALDLDPVQRDALAAALQRAPVGRRLQHEHGLAAARLRLDQLPRPGRADLLVPGDQDRQPGATGEGRGGVQGHHQARLHVEAAGAAQHAVADAERVGAQRAQGPDRVVVPEQQYPGRSVAEPPAQMGAALGDQVLRVRAEQSPAERGDLGRAAGERLVVRRRGLAGHQGLDVGEQCAEVRRRHRDSPRSGRPGNASVRRAPSATTGTPPTYRCRTPWEGRVGSA